MPSWVYVRYIKLPCCVKAVTVPNIDDTYDIYINSTLNAATQAKALDHEMIHIKQNHHYDNNPVALAEKEAG